MCNLFHVLEASLLTLAHSDNVSLVIVDSSLLTKLLQSLSSNQVVIAVSHDDMQTQLVDLTLSFISVQFLYSLSYSLYKFYLYSVLVFCYEIFLC